MDNIVSYLNRTVWATIAPSKLHGVGVFAIRNIPEGQKITDWQAGDPGEIITLSVHQVCALREPISDLILDRALQFEEEHLTFPSPNSQADLRAFMNDSATPNTDGTVTLRKVRKGEELTEDYSSFGKLSKASKRHFSRFL